MHPVVEYSQHNVLGAQLLLGMVRPGVEGSGLTPMHPVVHDPRDDRLGTQLLLRVITPAVPCAQWERVDSASQL